MKATLPRTRAWTTGRPRRPPAGRAPQQPGERGAPGTAVTAAPEPGALAVPLGPSPAITDNFHALPDSHVVIPPDTHGAVGPGHLMVALNSQVRLSEPRRRRRSSRTHAQRLLVRGERRSGPFDPTTLYDPYASRSDRVACDDARAASSAILVGASQTRRSDRQLVRRSLSTSTPTNTVWADFPSVGFNSKWVVVQFNLFRRSRRRTCARTSTSSTASRSTAARRPSTSIPDTNGFTQVARGHLRHGAERPVHARGVERDGGRAAAQQDPRAGRSARRSRS